MADEQSTRDGRPASWPYGAGVPERYWGNTPRYLARGGLVRLEEDAQGFVTEEPGNRGDIARFYFFCLALDQIAKERLPGDLAELGVYKGSTATLLATIARRLGRTAYLLDTFEGFSAEDLQGIDADKKMGFADTSLEKVRSTVGEDNVRFIKGRFPATAAELPVDGTYCLVHIDCDLYAPAMSALEYFYSRLVPGGFLIVHDYSSLHWNGAEQAVDEFFADKPEWIVPLTDQAGSIVVRKAGVREVGKAGAVARDPEWLLRRKQALIGEDWAETAYGDLAGALGDGWSDPEPWGIWGIGEVHELLLHLPSVPSGDIELDADVHAVLLGAQTAQLVDVLVGGRRVATWNFTQETNREVRSARIPLGVATAAGAPTAVPVLRVEFRPHSVVAPKDLDPNVSEPRLLGMALHRVRARMG